MILTLQGRLMVLVSRFFPRLADRIARRKVRALFRDEILTRQSQKSPATAPRDAALSH